MFSVSRIGWRPIVQLLVFVILLPFTLFLAAGRLDWLMAWVFLGVHVASTVVSRLIVYRANPDLLLERARSMQAEDAKAWDPFLVFAMAILGPMAIWITAGLDDRFGWSPEIPLAIQVASLTVVVLGYGLGTWAMAVNAYFSAVVRIQEDRGHTVIKGGPYQWVRHPAYAGGVVIYLAMPVMLASLWALVPAGIPVLALLVRTALEDQVLREELPGYVEYTQETRYRLIPGIW